MFHHRSGLAAAAVSGILMMAGTAAAQEKGGKAAGGGQTVTTTSTTYNGWTVVCTAQGKDKPKPQACTATFRVINQQNRANLLVWMFGFNANGEPLTEVLTLPDVLIAPGVQIKLGDAEPLKADFVSCNVNGCKASMPVSSAAAKLLKAAKSAGIGVTRSDGKSMQFNLEIGGLEHALRDLGL
jgi:invasion protein IalB